MKNKTIAKIAAAAMAAMMTVSTAAVPAMAVTKTSSSSSSSTSEAAKQKAMKEALTIVKKRVKIPDRLTEFNYSTTTKLGTECFEFTWRDKEYKESVNISIANGVIISYNHNDSRNDDKEVKQTFAKLSDEKLIEAAKKAFKMLDPDISGKVKYSVGSIQLFGDSATIKLDRVENGIAVDGNGGNIVINKDTGELISLNLEWFWEGTKFESSASKLTADEARAKYKSLSTLTPIYRIVSDYDEKTEKYTQKAVLLYLSDFHSEIDAVSGKKSTIWDDMKNDKGSERFGYYYYNSWDAGEETAVADDADEAGGVTFTEAELKEIAADESLLKKADITALLNKDKYTKMPDYVSLDNANLYKDEDTDEYFYEVTYSGGNEGIDVDDDVDADVDVPVEEVTTAVVNTTPYFYMYVYLNAKTGQVISFNKSQDKSFDSSKAYPVSANAKIAEEAAKHYYGDIFDEYKADESNSEPPEWYVQDGKKKYWTNRTYSFNRYVNGVKVEDDYISITVDFTGEVYYISKKYSDVEFPSVPKFDNDEAFKQIFKQVKLSLYYDGYYKKDGTVKTYLLYNLGDYILDSKYRVVDYYGNPISAQADEDTAYTDIKGISQENAIKTLARYGITLESKNGKFDPNGKLTDKEFAAVIYKATRNYVPYYIECGDYKKEEEAKTLTKKEAAKVFVDSYGGADFAALNGIYRAPFKDVAATDEYVGCIAIAKALGFASADSKGNYSPNKVLTRAQAMQMIYDYIKRLK